MVAISEVNEGKEGEIVPPPESDEWSLFMVGDLLAVLDDNHVRSDECQIGSLRHASYDFDISVAWEFAFESESSKRYGRAPRSCKHTFHDEADLDHYINEIRRDAFRNRDIGRFFMRELDKRGASGIGQGGSQRVKSYDECALEQRCSYCHGSGQHSCSNTGCTNGRRRCIVCNGSGHRSVWRSRTDYVAGVTVHQSGYETRDCISCFGRGSVQCMVCHGTGAERCSHCRQKGYVTKIVSSQVMARSHAGIRVQVGPASDKIETFLKTEHPNDIAKAIPSLVLEDLTCDDGGRVTARYRGKASLAQQDVTLHDWQWTLSSMGTDAYVFSKPSVFDDLLASELAAIRRRRDKKGDFRVTRGMALRIFREYRNIPALKRAMHDLAFAKTDGEAFHQDRVKRAAQGYISDAATADLTDAIVAILPKLSAHRSMAVWLLIMGVLGIVAFRFAAAMVPVSAAWDTISPGDAGALVAQGVVLAMGSCIAVLLATPLALLLSRIISKAQSLRLPKHYREKKRRSWKPAGRFVLVMPLVVALGISYSLSAGRFHLPPIQSALYEALPELMAFNTGPATPERDFVDDSIDRSTVYRRIQTYLNGHGYAVGAVDGIAGKRTRAQLRAYLHDHGLSESLSPDQIARYMQENP